jgi:hypothetical protein
MRATKSWFVEHGLGELGLSGAVYDMTPEDKERIVERLDANLAELESKGARISGWVYANGPGIANLATEVDIPWAVVCHSVDAGSRQPHVLRQGNPTDAA